MNENTITLSAGNVEYRAAAATVSIDDLISLLQEAQSEGATHVVGLSGNYRGAQYIRFGRRYGWLEDRDEY